MFFIFWVLCAVVTCIIAKNKGRNVFGWFIIGILLGIFAILIIAFLKPKLGTGKFKKCPHCFGIVEAQATKCRHCQSTLA